jgi:ParB-like chromosome segregation protein Spo0J
MNLIANVQREDVPPLELARMVGDRMKAAGITDQGVMAARIGKSRQWVNEMLGFLKLPPEVAGGVGAPTLGYRHLQVLKGLSTDHQQQVVKELSEGTLKPEGIHKRANQLKFTPKTPKAATARPADPAVTAESSVAAGPAVTAGPRRNGSAATTAAPAVTSAPAAPSVHSLATALKDEVADAYLPAFGKVGGVMRQTLDTAWQKANGKGMVKWGLVFVVVSWLWHPVLKTINYAFSRLMHVEVNQAINKNTVGPVNPVQPVAQASSQKVNLSDLSGVPAPTNLHGELRSGQKILFTWDPVPHCFYNFYSRPSWAPHFDKENNQPLQHATALWTSDSGNPDLYHFVVTAVNAQDQESVYSEELQIDTRPKP